MNPNHHDFIEIRYAELAAAAGEEGLTRKEAEETIAAELKAMAASGEIEVPIDWNMLVAADLFKLDDHDRRRQEDWLQYALDALEDATILGELDPILDRVCAVGDGLRKTYRYLSADDLLSIVQRKQRHAADATLAAQRTTDIVMPILRAMNARRADIMGQLF